MVKKFLLDGHERHGLSAVEMVFCMLVALHLESNDKFPEITWLSEKLGISKRQVESIKMTLEVRKIIENDTLKIDLSFKSVSYTPLPVEQENDEPDLWSTPIPPTARKEKPKKVEQVPEKNYYTNTADKIRAVNGRVKAPSVWGGADLTRYFRIRLNEIFDVTIPEMMRGKETGQAGILIRHLGNAELAKEIIDYLLDNWKMFCSKYKFNGVPSMGLILTYKDSIQAELKGKTITGGQRTERYDEQKHEEVKEHGW